MPFHSKLKSGSRAAGPLVELTPPAGGFSDSDESDSYAGEVGEEELLHRVRRFPPGGQPPRRPGFMFPPPPAGPPPEPGDLYSVLQCKDTSTTSSLGPMGGRTLLKQGFQLALSQIFIPSFLHKPFKGISPPGTEI